jgi:chorismate mutase
MVPLICEDGDDGQYGSSVEHDVFAFQAIGRRVHYGSLYVAESKYRGRPAHYQRLIEQRDTAGLMDALTRLDVEQQILDRVRTKVAHVQGQVNRAVRKVVDPEVVLTFYRDHLIPLTKEGEVLYLLNRRTGN